MIRNQLGRRNLTPYQRAELALRLKPLIAAKAKEKQEREGRELGGTLVQKSGQGILKTDNELARVAGVSHDTIHKATVIAEKAPEEVKERLRAGERVLRTHKKGTTQGAQVHTCGLRSLDRPGVQSLGVSRHRKRDSLHK